MGDPMQPPRLPVQPCGAVRACLLLALLVSACVRAEPEGNVSAEVAPSVRRLEFEPPPPGSYSLPAIQKATDGRVLDADGTQRRLFDYLGDRLVFLSPFYRSCVDAKGCPLSQGTFHALERVLAADPGLADEVRLVSLSFDPLRDTPEALLEEAGEDYLATGWRERRHVFLTTASREDLAPILEGFGQYVVREVDAEGRPTGNLSHLLKVFLVDRDLDVRNIYGASYLHPEVMLNDVETLLLAEGEEEAI